MSGHRRTTRAPSRFNDPPADHDELRERYRPRPIAVLFIGESPPAGPTFFYRRDSRLFSAMKDAFQQAYSVTFPSDEAFLLAFQASGCFLDDLCSIPINGEPRGLRRQEHRKAVPELTKRLTFSRPRVVVPVMRLIERHVERAVQDTGLAMSVFTATPFPAFGHASETVRALAEHVRHLRLSGVLPSTLP